jgi:3-isopropylmalate/(R)-2-methylmalate dehydratase small subunit
MDKFVVHQGIAAPLLRANIDTDAIIPSREMKRVSKVGLAAGLFAGWRYLDATARTPDPAFVLNQPSYAGASILLTGVNFGCGSSREHAVWALKEFGIRAIVAPSFGAIFHNNCVRNGVLPVVVEETAVRQLADQITQGPVTVDLERCVISSHAGSQYRFEVTPAQRQMLLEGLDPIGLTLKLGDQIATFQDQDRQERPWIYLAPAA